MNLSLRLTLVFGAVGLVLITTIGAMSWWLAADQIRGGVDDELRERAELLSELGRGDIDQVARVTQPELAPPAGAVFGNDESGLHIVSFDGTVLSPMSFELTEAALAAIQPGAEPIIETVVTEDGRYRVVTAAVPEERRESFEVLRSVAAIQLFREISAEEAAITGLAWSLFAVALAGLVVVALASWVIGNWLATPVRRLTGAAERLAELDAPPERIEIGRADEIGRLAESFNRMLSTLEVGKEQQRRLVADASHELRTPLTSVRMRAEFLAANPDIDDDERESMLHGAVADIEQLSALVDDLVDLAAAVRSGDEPPEPVTLSDLADEVAERTSVATNRRIEVDADRSSALVRPTMIRRAMQNLVDNAAKYSPDPAPITIRIDRGRIEVIDGGPGIAPEDADHVFDRFYRSPKARTRPGNGIGLAIVQQVATVHGGSTWVGAAPSGGARVGFSVHVHLSP